MKKSSWLELFTTELSKTILNTKITNKIFQQSGKQDFFKHILKRWANMFQSLGPQLLKTNNGIKSRPEMLEDPRAATTFYNIFVVIDIL